MEKRNQHSISKSSSEKKDILYVIKIGGNIIDNDVLLNQFLVAFASINEAKILVHGGGKSATRLAEILNLPQKLINGRRVTDAETLKIVTMVYAGEINKTITARLQGYGCSCMGLTGADGNFILADKRKTGETDYGFAGDVKQVSVSLAQLLLQNGFSLVVAPITHDGKGQLLNTNADTIAREIAQSLSLMYDIKLVYSFEKNGVLMDIHDQDSFLKKITPAIYKDMSNGGLIHSGMIPKLDNAFTALQNGVGSVILGNAVELESLLNGRTGTLIAHD